MKARFWLWLLGRSAKALATLSREPVRIEVEFADTVIRKRFLP